MHAQTITLCIYLRSLVSFIGSGSPHGSGTRGFTALAVGRPVVGILAFRPLCNEINVSKRVFVASLPRTCPLVMSISHDSNGQRTGVQSDKEMAISHVIPILLNNHQERRY